MENKKKYLEFGAKLKDALKRIEAHSSQRPPIVEDYISGALGYSSPDTLRKWRQGERRPNEDQLVKLVRILKDPKQFITEIRLESPDLDRPWLEAFVKRAKYPYEITDSLLKEIFPETDTESKPVPVPPPEPSSLDEPPDPEFDFIGRGKELFALQEKLRENNFVILTGMPGVGKTALASALYKNRQPKYRFWYSFQQLDGLSDLINKLANFLHKHGDSSIHQQLEKNSSSSLMMLDWVLQKMSGQGYLLCFDDLNHIEDSNRVKQILAPFLQYIRRGDFELLVISRERPLARMDGVDMKPFVIEGLNEDETDQLLSQLNQPSSEETQASSHQLTQGNPQFLILMAEILNQQGNLSNLLGRIGQALDVENYIIEEVDENLDDNERYVMYALSICMGYPVTYLLIERIMAQGNLRKAVRNLCNRHLILLYKDADADRYSLHAILQQFYDGQLSESERIAMHARAAAYYSTDEQDVFKAALHYEKAGKFERAVEHLIGDNTSTLIYQGHASAASRLLVSLQEKKVVDDSVQLRLLQSLGTFYRIQGEYEPAIQTLVAGLKQVGSPSEQIEFLDEMTRTHRYQGAFEKALQTIEQIQEIYEHNPTLLMEPKILNNMGWVYYRLGNIEAAEHYFTLAWGNDGEGLAPAVLADTLLGLGTVANIQEKPDVAIQRFSKAQSLFKQIGDSIGLAYSLNNLGLAHIRMQEFEEALVYLEEALDTSETIGYANLCIIIAYNIAILYMDQKDYGAADACLKDMYPLAQRIQNYPLLCRFAASRSEIAFHQNRLTQAKEHLAMAQQWVEKVTSDGEQGIVHYVSGIIAITEEKHEQALQLLESAIPLLEKSHETDYLVLAQDALNSLSS